MDYLAIQSMAAESIRAAGAAYRVTRKSSGQFDEVAGKAENQIEQRWTVYALKGSLGKTAKYAQVSTKAQSLIAAGGTLLLCAVTQGYVPASGDTYRDPQGVDWLLEYADPLGPGGIDLIQHVIVRR